MVSIVHRNITIMIMELWYCYLCEGDRNQDQLLMWLANTRRKTYLVVKRNDKIGHRLTWEDELNGGSLQGVLWCFPVSRFLTVYYLSVVLGHKNTMKINIWYKSLYFLFECQSRWRCPHLESWMIKWSWLRKNH